ncbi:T9SS type A sorting domain-containing protein [Flavobacterium notoginsengisoli]|uniref:T9SS type A sorting domain-containing protein n=1 Tax=Flavobacterium notoginsengisoli TaxID=1478199 RepID=UPI003625C73E
MKKTLLCLFILLTNLFYAQVTTVTVCNNDPFNLTTLKPNFIGNLNPAETTVTYFLSENNALNNTNSIVNPTVYKGAVGTTKIYGRIDNKGTITVNYADLNTLPSLNVTASNKPILCKGTNTSLAIKATGGSDSYSYSLNGSSFANLDYYDNLPAGVYNIRVLDKVTNCTTSFSYTITEPAALVATVATTNQNTFVTAIGGTKPYKYSVDGVNYQTNNYFSNLAQGNYNIIVSDSEGCLTSVPVTILPALTSSTTITSGLSCNRDMATISITAAGGKAPYVYSVNGVPYQSGNIFYNLYAGTYTVMVKDALNTTSTASLYIEPYLPLQFTKTITAPNCYGGTDGKVEISTLGGRSPYSYKIDNGPVVSSNIFSNLTTGYYTIAVIDALGCSDKFDIFVPETSQMNIVESVTNAGIDNNNGEIKVTASNGNPSYTYSLHNNNGTILKGPQSSNIFSGLSAGSYQVKVTDSKGCFATRSYIDVQQSTIIANLTVNSITCNNPKGSIEVVVTGGVPPYQYSLDYGNYTSSNVFNNLTPQTYTIRVKDAQNGRVSLSGTVIQSTPLTLSTKLDTPVFCNGESTGTILSTPSGGKSPYTYSIDNGVTFQSSRYFLNLKAGTYNITTKDANNCIAVSSITLSEPPALTATYQIVNDQNIFITASGGSNLYTYYITNTTTGIQYGPETVGAFTKLPPGLYTLELGDSSGCRFSQSGIKIEASQSTALSAVSVVNPAGCLSLGRIVVSAMGGKTPYQYSINNGTNYSSTNSFSSLTPGTYAVKVRDADLNTTSHSVTINPVGSAPTITAIATNVTCQGLKNGTISVKASGGSGTYSYSLNGVQQGRDTFSNLAPGNYTIKAQDMNLCTATITVVITEPNALNAAAKVGLNQDITVNTTGGSAPYSYSLENENGVQVAAPQSSNIFSNLATGLYTVKVIDANACSVTLTNINVIPVTELYASATATNITCSNPRGSIQIEAIGGVKPYQYSLDDLTYVSSNLFENLDAKNYAVKVKDAQNTVFNLNATVAQTTLLTVSGTIETDIHCPGDNTGFISALAKGGAQPYQYSIDGITFKSNRYFLNLKAGNYTITVKDNNGCIAVTSPLILSEPTPLSGTYTIVNEENIVLTATGGSTIYGYSLEDANGVKFGPDQTGRYTKLAPGTYKAIINDSKGCAFQISGIKIEPSSSTNLTIATFADPVTCTFRGRITIIAKGGRAPYQYSLNNGETYSSSNVIVGLTANYTYPVKVRDADLNTVTAQVPMTLSDSATRSTAVVTDVSCAGNNDGKIKVVPYNNEGQHLYSINGSPASTLDTFENLAPGNYTVSVQDKNFCQYYFIVVVKEPTPLIANIELAPNTLTATVVGGNAPYSYTLENENGTLLSQTTNTFSNIPAGLYKLHVIDANRCSILMDVTIAPPAPSIEGKNTLTVEFKQGQTLGDLTIDGQNIKWYSTPGATTTGKTGKSAETTLPLSTILVDGVTYYASQTINGIESKNRLAVTAKVNGSLSTPDFELADFRFYPNPVKHILNIQYKSIIDDIQIFSVSGQSVLFKKINNTHSEIDLSNLPRGMYILNVKTDGKEKAVKFIKE